jgi:hypothetical protein
LSRPTSAAEEFLVPDGNRSTAVHRIPLLPDPTLKETAIGPEDQPALPYSPRATCGGKCHDYAAIETGWHFNAPDRNVPPGRPGEPYILTDLATGTQIPVSPRGWFGTRRPEDLGLTPWKFTLAFGGHTPGGGYGEKFSGQPGADPAARWMVSGKLEIDCQSCHSGDPLHDQSLWATNIERENLAWAPTAACGFALMKGIAKTVPETWDPMMPSTGDNPKEFPPSLEYDKWRFNANKEVFFDVVRKSAADRCYFCHTSRPAGPDASEKWQEDEDVHLKAGLNCSDCHRHGLDHKVVRGYEGEPAPAGVPTLTCRGCHLGDQSAAAGPASPGRSPDTSGRSPDTMGGRLGAPVPEHRGMPTTHFEKLSCTACHSGPMPGKTAGHVQTSRAHGLGVKGKEHRDDAPPFIQWPVFMRQASDGTIAPHKVLWPAYWCRMQTVVRDLRLPKVIPPEVVQAAAKEALASADLKKWKPLTAEQIRKILTVLSAQEDPAGDPKFVSGGRVYYLVADGSLSSTTDWPGQPYAWPVAHNVRPKAQSLGSGGCTDCHASDSAIFFGQVQPDSMIESEAPVAVAMYEFLGKDPTELRAWGMSYQFRPFFKVVAFAAAAMSAAVLLLYAFLGLAAALRRASGSGGKRTDG